MTISSPNAIHPCRARWQASGPAAEPVAGSSGMPSPGAKHPGRPPGARSGEAVVAEDRSPCGRQPLERDEVRGERIHRVLVLERDVDVLNAVVVDLDRQRRAVHAECPQERVRVGMRRHRWDRLSHPSEGLPARFVAHPGGEGDPVAILMARATAVPRTGCPANGNSLAGVKIRTRASAPAAGGSTNTVSLNPISSASGCRRSSGIAAPSVKIASWLPASARSVKTSTIRNGSSCVIRG